MAFKLNLAFKLKLATIASSYWFGIVYFVFSMALVSLGVYLDQNLICSIGGLLVAIPIGWTFYNTFAQIFFPREH